MNQFPAIAPQTGHREGIGGGCRSRFRKEAWRAPLAAVVLALAPGHLLAADAVVSNISDSGAGSLRQAIADVSAGGTVSFSAGLAGQTILLSSELSLDKAVVIDAAALAGGVKVSGGGAVRLFHIGASGAVTLKGLALTGGKGIGAQNNGFGGAVYNIGTLTVDRCSFAGNAAAEYGGGIFNGQNGTLTVRGSTFTVDGIPAGNSAGLYGGAIFNSSLLTVDGCTFDRNTSGFEGGAIYSDFSSTLTVTNSTFTGNIASFYGGALFNGSPRMSLESCTLVGNVAVRIGGGVYNDFLGTPISLIRNSIITQNSAPEGANTFGPWVGTNNITTGDPKLSPLGNFGGPTQTMPPLPDSPAIDAGGATTLLTDQRGQPRVLRNGPDIGASEVPAADYNRDGLTVYARVTELDQDGVFEISTDPDFLPAVSTYAGTGTAGYAGGARLSSELFYPSGVARDSMGNIFFADTGNHRIRMIGADGRVTSIAGSGVYGLSNGPGSSAAFAFPSALTVGPDDNVYVADTFNHRICRITRPAVDGGAWTVTNLAGTGAAGYVEGGGTIARFNFPYGVVVDADGNVFVADSLNHRIRKVTPGGVVSTYAGSGTKGYQDALSPGTAKFDTPQGVAISGADLYVADTGNHRIRKVVPAPGGSAGEVSTFAGGAAGFSNGTGTSALFNTPSSITADGAGSLYVADENNNAIRRIDSLAGVSTVAGTGQSGLVNGKSDVARFYAPTGVVVGLDGNLIVADSENHVLRRVAIKPLTLPSVPFTDSYGVQVKYDLDVMALGLDPGVTYYFRWKSGSTGVTQVLGQSFYLYDFPTVETQAASGLTPDTAVFNALVDPKNGRTTVTFEYSTDPGLLNPYEVSTLAGSSAGFSNPSGVVANAAGDVFVADRLNHRILKITSGGAVSVFAGSGVGGFEDGSGTAAKFERPTGLAIDGAGNIYVADEASHRIRMITPGGVVSTFAGSGIAGYAEGDTTTARFLYPAGVAVDASGNVYVADTGNHRIRRVAAGTGVVTTAAGTGVAGFGDGAAESAQFSSPQGVAVDSIGSVVVADTGNHSIRVVSAGNVTTLAGDGSEGSGNGPGASARFASPRGVAVGAGDVIYVADSGNNRIRLISGDEQVSTLAGSGAAGQTDSPLVALFPATAATFDHPAAVTVTAGGTLYVTQEGRLRKIARSGTLPVVTVTPDAAGTGERVLSALAGRPLLYGTTYYFRARGTGYRGTVTGEIFSFVTPRADISVFAGTSTAAPALAHLQADVVTFGNTPTGQPFTRQFTISNPGTWPLDVSTVSLPAGFQLTGGTGIIPPSGSVTFQITVPASLAGNYGGNVTISNDAPEKTVFTFPIAGVVLDPPVLVTLEPTAQGSGTATFNATVNPRDSGTTVWFEWSQDPDFDGVNVTTLAGSSPGYEEGTGSAAKFNQPAGIVTDADGNTYVADQQNHRIRLITPDGTASTFAGTGVAGYANGTANSAQFDQPSGLAMNEAGVLFVADSNNHVIRAIDPAGNVSTYSGLGAPGFTDGIPGAARFINPAGLAIDSLGVLYVADTGNNRIRVVALDGSVSTLAGTGVAGAANGDVTVAQFNGPLGIARDSVGFVYVTETGSHAVRKVGPDGSTSILAGSAVASGFADAASGSARFSSPSGLGVGTGGVVYVADKGNHRIRRITPAGVVTTAAGSGASGTLDGFGDVAEFFSPSALVALADGTVMAGDSGSSAIRKITSLQTLLPAAAGLEGTVTLPVALGVSGLPASGPYYFRSIATNGGGSAIGATIGVNVGPSGFSAWQGLTFGTDAGNPLIAGWSANPSGDGVSNLLKYAFGLDPHAASTGGLPVMGLNGGVLTLAYAKVLSAADITYTVQWSTDLSTWNSTGITEQTLGVSAGTEQVLATATGAPAQAKFIRVLITLH